MPNLRPTGTCKLCGYEKELCDSHYLPKGMYRFARAPELKNPNPVMSVDGVLTQISDQYRDYVFCSDCEGLLNENGERWVQANMPRTYGGDFPLQDAIKSLQPFHAEQDLEVYNVLGEDAFDVQKLVYFGISIFWRGAVHRWTSSKGQRVPEVQLGTLQEPVREFLLGARTLPDQLVITLNIWPFADSKTIPGLWAPCAAENPLCQEYWFCVPGLVYRLIVGKDLPFPISALNLSRGIVSVDRQLGIDILAYTKSKLQSLSKGPKISKMFESVEPLRLLRK